MKALPVKIILVQGTKRQLYVSKERLRANAIFDSMEARGEPAPHPLPPLAVRNDSLTDGVTVTYCTSVVIRGPSRFVYKPHEPLTNIGPIAWLETEAEIELTL